VQLRAIRRVAESNRAVAGDRHVPDALLIQERAIGAVGVLEYPAAVLTAQHSVIP
jgi:hypothetical protein